MNSQVCILKNFRKNESIREEVGDQLHFLVPVKSMTFMIVLQSKKQRN